MLPSYVLNKIKTQLPQLDQLYSDLFDGGKGIRAHLVQDVCSKLNKSKEDANFLSEMVENIHHCSLLHDDVIDASLFRRNKKSAWAQFSRKKAILAGDYLLAHTALKLSSYGSLELLKVTSQTIKDMVKGEWLQQEILMKETLKELDHIHILKTATLFSWCLRAPFLCQKEIDTSLQGKLIEIGIIFGQLFQRADDAMDFNIHNKEQKPAFKDLKEGYLNYFGVFLREQAGKKYNASLRQCRSASDLENLLGREKIEEYTQSFDNINKDLMKKCISKIDNLKSMLKPDQESLIPSLKEWLSRLYLRD